MISNPDHKIVADQLRLCNIHLVLWVTKEPVVLNARRPDPFPSQPGAVSKLLKCAESDSLTEHRLGRGSIRSAYMAKVSLHDGL